MSQNNGNGVVDPGPFVEQHDHLKHNYLERVAPDRRRYDEAVGIPSAMDKVASALGYSDRHSMGAVVASKRIEAAAQKKASGS